jgi:peptidoglycan/LPS O-acetylase OafA/YrhL
MVDTTALPAPEAIDESLDGGTAPPLRGQDSGKLAVRPRHFPCFDGLRAIAAVLVVLVHTSFDSGFTLRSPNGIYTARFEIGVSVFFLISGFLLYRPFAASHIAGRASPAIRTFWARRLLRILPAYWLAFVVTSYVMHANKIVPGWHALLIYLGLLQIYFPGQALSGITQAWSLCTEMSFYLFLPLFASVVVMRRRGDRQQMEREVMVLAALFAIGLGVRFWMLHLHSAAAGVMESTLPAYLDLFALGMFLAVASSWVAHRRIEPRWLWHPMMPWVSWALALSMLWTVSHIGISRLPLHHIGPDLGITEEALYGLFAFFLLLPAVFGPQHRGLVRRALTWKPVAALGVVSYGLYLWHQSWGILFIRWTGLMFRLPLWEIFPVVLALGVASAALSYVFVERPILGLKDRLGWWSGTPGSGAAVLGGNGPTRRSVLSASPVGNVLAEQSELLGEDTRLVLEPAHLPAQVHTHDEEKKSGQDGEKGRGADDAQGVGEAVEEPRRDGEDGDHDTDR